MEYFFEISCFLDFLLVWKFNGFFHTNARYSDSRYCHSTDFIRGIDTWNKEELEGPLQIASYYTQRLLQVGSRCSGLSPVSFWKTAKKWIPQLLCQPVPVNDYVFHITHYIIISLAFCFLNFLVDQVLLFHRRSFSSSLKAKDISRGQHLSSSPEVYD